MVPSTTSREASAALEAGVVDALRAGMSDVGAARQAGIDRGTVRKLLGKTRPA